MLCQLADVLFREHALLKKPAPCPLVETAGITQTDDVKPANADPSLGDIGRCQVAYERPENIALRLEYVLEEMTQGGDRM